jgi:prolyl-tRNA editing enzyme YbaK/EbsC (Cys-tRNA(Pro) deacylase)
VSDEAATKAIEARVAATLDGLGVPYEVHRIDPAFADTGPYCERYGVPPDRSANTIIVASKKEPKQHAACVVPATTRLDVNHTVRRLMSVSRASFASAQETIDLTGMMIGGVTVLALPAALPIYVDDRLMGFDWIILGGGSRSSKIKVSPELFRRLAGAQIVPGLGVLAPAPPGAGAC